MRTDLAGYALAALAVVCATIFGVTGHEVPAFLPLIAVGGAGAGAGASMPAPRARRATDKAPR